MSYMMQIGGGNICGNSVRAGPILDVKHRMRGSVNVCYIAKICLHDSPHPAFYTCLQVCQKPVCNDLSTLRCTEKTSTFERQLSPSKVFPNATTVRQYICQCHVSAGFTMFTKFNMKCKFIQASWPTMCRRQRAVATSLHRGCGHSVHESVLYLLAAYLSAAK